MTPTRSSGYSTNSTGVAATTYNMDTAGVAVGDWAILTIQAGLTTATWTPSLTGWTTIAAPTTFGSRRATVLARKRLAGDPASFTVTCSGVTTQRGVLVGVSGALDVGSWVIGTFTTRATMGSDGFHNVIPGVTTTSADNLVLTISLEATTADEGGAHPGVANATEWVFEGQTGVGTVIESVGYYYAVKATAGATGTVTTTHPNVQASNGAGITFAIPPSDPRGPGLPVYRKTASGTELLRWYKVTPAGVRTPSSAVFVPTGYPSITDMLATANFKVAHRGGSNSFPEMSLHAYTQSILRNYKALEISLARTSDGVWFGLHDQTLDRTSGVTGVTASALTWAQVQTYQISAGLPAGQTAKPYMRWEQIIAAYGQTHVLFIDVKYAVAYRTELLDLMDAVPGGKTRFVAKYFGVEGNTAGTTGWAADARARGYKTWGYFYETDLANLPTYQGRWDILGMEYGASASAWTTILAYGKPVIAHICPDQTAVNTAQSKGAVGYMVSGTGIVTA